MATLLQAYNTSAAPRSAQAMECLSQLASVRRSLFPNQETRQAFLHRVLTAVVTVLRGQQRLGEEENFHEFCRLLSRVKSNFQLGEMIKCGDVYQELIQLVAQFTVQSLQVRLRVRLCGRVVRSSACSCTCPGVCLVLGHVSGGLLRLEAMMRRGFSSRCVMLTRRLAGSHALLRATASTTCCSCGRGW